MRLEIALKSEFDQFSAHTILLCVYNRNLYGFGQFAHCSRIQYVKVLIDAAVRPHHLQEANDAGNCWHCRSGHSGNSLRVRFAVWAGLDYLGGGLPSRLQYCVKASVCQSQLLG